MDTILLVLSALLGIVLLIFLKNQTKQENNITQIDIEKFERREIIKVNEELLAAPDIELLD